MAHAFVVFRHLNGDTDLCEGGVYSLDARGDYSANTLDAADKEAALLNNEWDGVAGEYLVVTSMAFVAVSEEVAGSLEGWQIDIIEADEKTGLIALGAVRRAREKLPLVDGGSPRETVALTADSKLAALYRETELSLADRTQLRGSPFAAARIASRYLVAFADKREPADLACACDALVQLEAEACAKASESREATERAHGLGASLAEARRCVEKLTADCAAYREQRDAEGARAVKAERQLAEHRTLLAALPVGMAMT